MASESWSDKFSSGWATLILSVSEESRSVANNETTLTCKLQIKKNSECTSNNSGGATVWMKINGEKVYNSSSFSIKTLGVGKTKTLATETVKVKHNSDGSKSIKCSAYLASGVGLGTASISSKTFTCTTIPRVSTVSCPSSFTVGSAGKVSITRKSSSFTHTVSTTLGNTGLSATSGIGTSFTYTPPYSLFNSESYKNTASIKNNTMKIQTKSGSSNVGSAVSKTFSVALPQNSNTKPTCSVGSSLSEYGSNHLSKYGVLIAGKSRLQLSGCSSTGKYCAEISAHYPSLAGTTCTYSNGTITTSALSASSSGKAFSYYVKDSRGFTSQSITSSVTVPAVASYSTPQLSVSAKRTTNGIDDTINGKEVTFTIRANVSKIVQDLAYESNANTATIYIYRLKYNDDGQIISRHLLDTGDVLNNIGTGTYSVTVTKDPLSDEVSESMGFNPAISYGFELTSSDDFTSEAALGKGIQAKIGTAETMISFYGNKGVSIGKVAESEGFNVDWNSVFNKEVLFKGETRTTTGYFDNLYLKNKSFSPVDVSVIYDTTNCSALVYRCKYIPALNMVFFRGRFSRKATVSSEKGVVYNLGTVDSNYSPSSGTPLTLYLSNDSSTADIIGGYISPSGLISIRLRGSTNPDYFYLSGFWFIE